ncbi:granulocyte colony-stimulating factor receptor [Rhineura floridana]|uniref:granulocyte colony-stimulating factor receptor n=1 Tax=Rhineura floridana TaxID=261503 RepID=UPI002AC85386|nr:granulocyte colony-stimulating factor receptor [Rhineura floridana]XP_061453517.1 granulocyte colony-stimulating factor receptor [Rhineura floridana]
MASTKKPWQWVLGCSFFFFLIPGGSLHCSNLNMDSPVILLGATATASCTIWRSSCRIQQNEELLIMWKLDEEFLKGTQYSLSNGVEVSNITVGPLNETVTSLSCYVQRKGKLQMMNVIQIHAGYPPMQPQNLTCVMNVTTKSLTCHWDPGRDSLLPVSIALKCFWNQRGCEVPPEHIPPVCIPLAGQNSCTIGRENLLLYHNMIFWVSAKNPLGVVESEPLCADPIDLVRLDPPALQTIQAIPEETDCVSVAWEAPKDSEHMHMSCDLRYRKERDWQWTVVHNITNPARERQQTQQMQSCGFLFGTLYQFQMRCQRVTGVGYWSNWSPTMNFSTHEKEPSGELDAWWKVKPREADKRTEVQLLWKPMKPDEAHGKILGYWATLSTRWHNGEPSTLCNTTELHCAFSLPFGTQRISLMAYNTKGLSQPTEVFLLEKKGQPVPSFQVSPHNEKSIWARWDLPGAPATGYIIEWHRVTSADSPVDNNFGWTKVQSGAITQALIQENVDPFQCYNISIYPLYRDGVGMPKSVEVYTRQKAPSETPKLHPGIISKSTAEIHWEPIPVEKQNGFIINYTIFWIGTNEDMSSAVMNSSVDTFTIKGLWPSRMYRVHIMASTVGGSTNGSILVLYTKGIDDTDLPFVYLLIGLLLLAIIVLVICFHKSKRMKTQFWPSVPDPANSSLGRWAPAILQEEILQAPKACELSPVMVSAILVIEVDEKKCLSCGKSEPTKALEDGPMAAFSESYISDADAALPASGPRPASYMNSPESVQYAKVFGDSYRSQQKASPTFYIRSNSTQPLLCDMTPSPKSYENLWFHSDQANRELGCNSQEDAVFTDTALLDFPLLQGLKIDGDEDLSNFRRP